MITFPVFYRIYYLWANFLWKIQIVNLNQNLVATQTRICKIPWWCSFFLYESRNSFWTKKVRKIKIAVLSLNLIPRLIQIFIIQKDAPVFCFFTGNTLFEIKIFNLSWNLIPRQIRICRIQWWYPILRILSGNVLFGQIWSK